jgi:NAD-dependent oxidoreductase involved in siderophore biosynthesis
VLPTWQHPQAACVLSDRYPVSEGESRVQAENMASRKTLTPWPRQSWAVSLSLSLSLSVYLSPLAYDMHYQLKDRRRGTDNAHVDGAASHSGTPVGV